MTSSAPSPVVLLVEDREGDWLAVRFANREAAERFERRTSSETHGLLQIVSQTEAVLRGVGAP